MEAFHGDRQLKDLALRRLVLAANAGELEPGYGTSSDRPGELIISLCGTDKPRTLAQFGEQFGLSDWITLLYVHVFEISPPAFARAWAVAFLQAIPVGVDLALHTKELFAEWLTDHDVGLAPLCKPDAEAHEVALRLAEFFRTAERIPAACEDPVLRTLHKRSQLVEKRLRRSLETPTWKRSVLPPRVIYQLIRSMHAIDWMVAGVSSRALMCMQSAHLECLSEFESHLVALWYGRSELMPNFRSPIGQIGFSRRADHDRFVVKVMDWMIRWTHRVIGAASEHDQVAAVRDFRACVVQFTSQVVSLKEPELNLPHGLKYPPRLWRRLIHVFMKAASVGGEWVGWTILFAGLLMFFGGSVDRQGLVTHLTPILLVVVSSMLISLARKLSGGFGWYQLLDTGKRPVIFLRSFGDDRLVDPHEQFRLPGISRVFLWRWLGRRPEEFLAAALEHIGPVVAIQTPGQGLPTAGASRISVGDTSWEDVVSMLVRHAALVVVMPGYREGVRWEMRHVRKAKAAQQVLLYTPRAKRREFVRYDEDGESRTYGQFLEDLLLFIFEGDLEWSHRGNFVWFSPSWRPRPLAAFDPPHWSNPIYEDSTVAELEPVMTYFGVTPSRNRLALLSCWAMAVVSVLIAILIAEHSWRLLR